MRQKFDQFNATNLHLKRRLKVYMVFYRYTCMYDDASWKYATIKMLSFKVHF